MKKKISFVIQPNPVLIDDAGQVCSPVRTNLFPIPQVTLAGMLNPRDYSMQLLDLRSVTEASKWKKSGLNEYATPFMYGKKKLRRFLIGNYKQKIENSDDDVDIYILTANFTSELNAVKETAKELKKKNVYAKIIIGGRDVAAMADTYARIAEVDHVVLGNSIQGLQDVIDHAGTNHLGKIIDIGLSDVMPQPNLELLSAFSTKYESGGGQFSSELGTSGRYAYLQTSRGCPNRCAFCTENSHFIVSDVVAVKALINAYIALGFKNFGFVDSNILFRKEKEIEEIFKFLAIKNLAWEFPAGLEIKKLFDEQGRFKEQIAMLLLNNKPGHFFTGLHRMLVPLEDCLIRYSKYAKCQNLNYEKFLDYIILKEVPYINIGIMIGHPLESRENRDRLLNNLRYIYLKFQSTKTIVNFSIFCSIPLPGTGFYAQMQKQNRIKYNPIEFPELYTIFNSVIDGVYYSAENHTSFREQILREFNMEQHLGKVDPHYK